MKPFSKKFIPASIVLIFGVLGYTPLFAAAPPPIDSSLQGSPAYQQEQQSSQVSGQSATPNSPSSSGPNSSVDLKSTNFTFDPNTLSPTSQGSYSNGKDEGTPRGNTIALLHKISQFLLVIVSTGAVLFIVVGGFVIMISAGDNDRATKGKNIVSYNIQALIIALLAYGVIQFVIWIL